MAPPLKQLRPERWILAAAVIGWALWRLFSGDAEPEHPQALAVGQHRVARAVDGDTLLLENGARVRLIGVDTPETVHPDLPPEPGGAAASAFTQQAVGGRSVELTFDRERQDRFGRFLAYVWLDGKLLNEELIRQGYGRATLQYNYSPSMKRRFKQAQTAARQERLGIWTQPLESPPPGR